VALLTAELARLSLRSEVDFRDQDLDPERSLLRLAHEKSTLFNVGVALLEPAGTVVFSEPESFLAAGVDFGAERWWKALRETGRAQVFTPAATAAEARLEVASPVLRGQVLQGAVLGAVDLLRDTSLTSRSDAGIVFALVDPAAGVVAPVGVLATSMDTDWRDVIFGGRGPLLLEVRLSGTESVVASAPVEGTDLRLVSVVPEPVLYGPARERLRWRLLLGLALACLPFLLLVFLLRGSLRAFHKAEEGVLRDERLRSLGEAVDLIAHEVKNSLNGIRVGLDLVLRGSKEPRNERALDGMRTEIERLSEFTTELLGFSKGVVPRPVALDLGEFVRKVSDLAHDTAEGRGVALTIHPASGPVPVRADPALLHVVIANLVGNAVDFAGGGDAVAPAVAVEVAATRTEARVRVVDNGPGVAKGVKPRLFEPFVTGRPTGVGIGLALSRRIARAHGGDLVLEEAPSGASFILTLPLKAA
jgi:signal transduction histidine kinase